MKYADLHLHTSYSDGTYTVEELLAKAKKAGLSCISVVDHDTTQAVPLAREKGKHLGIEVLSGVELTCAYAGREVHILGYLINERDSALIKKLRQIRQVRKKRIYQMLEKLKKMQIEVLPEEVFSLAHSQSVGRLHLARVLAKKGYASSITDAFSRFIGDDCPAYVCGFKLSIPEAIAIIQKTGGIPVLAHPYTLGNDELIFKFIDFGIKGLEVFYPEHTKEKVSTYKNIALKYNLLVTGGSDCHGKAKPAVLIGKVKIPYTLVQKLKQAQDNKSK